MPLRDILVDFFPVFIPAVVCSDHNEEGEGRHLIDIWTRTVSEKLNYGIFRLTLHPIDWGAFRCDASFFVSLKKPKRQ